MRVVWLSLVEISDVASVTIARTQRFLMHTRRRSSTSVERRILRPAGTAGRFFKPGTLVKKKGGHAWLGMEGILIKAFVNTSGNALAKVLTEKTVMHWPLQHVEIIE